MPTHLNHQNLPLGISYAIATSLVMSVTAAMIKFTAEQVSIEIIVFFQYLVCLLVMLPWLVRKRVNELKTKYIGLHFIRGLSGWACFYTYYLALSHIPLAEAALLRNSAPICVPLLLLLWKGIRIPLLRWIPIVMGLIGVSLFLRPEASGISFWHIIGFGSAITLAGSMVTTRFLTSTESNYRILFYYFFISTVAGLPLALLNWAPIPVSVILPMILIGLSLWLVMWLYTQAYRFAKASVISPLNYLGVIFTGFWGWLFWYQVPDRYAIIGASLVIVGGLLALALGREQAPDSNSTHLR